MNKIKHLFQENKPLVIILSTLVIFSIIIILIIILLSPSNTSGGDSYIYTDKISGEMMRDINQEPEVEEAGQTSYIGFDRYLEYGYSYDEYDTIMNIIHIFINENYPDTTQVSFRKGSFHYQSDNDRISFSEFTIIDNDITFTVKIDLSIIKQSTDIVYYNIKQPINISILDQENNLVFNYKTDQSEE